MKKFNVDRLNIEFLQKIKAIFICCIFVVLIFQSFKKEEYVKLKEQLAKTQQIEQNWQRGDWEYNWFGNGLLKSVKKPDGSIVSFEYDALGRRTSKTVGERVNRYLWSGNVLLHEWNYDIKDKPKTFVNDLGEIYLSKQEPVNDLITWVYEEGTFVPSAKIEGDKTYSIISDYIGRPVQAYNTYGKLVWETDYDIYGNLRNLKGEKQFIPFRQLGQYFDKEINLCYNRFRYYSPESGLYISQDPIGLAGNNPNFYAYVRDTNIWLDVFGLDVYGLYTTADGWYPAYTKGQAQPTSYIFMKKDELYKIGESQNPAKRYSTTALEESRINKSSATSFAVDANGKVIQGQTAGLRMNFFDQGGTKQADRLLENQLLENYENKHGKLPAGNKTCH